ncbi:MAG: hypothetical protein C0486_01480 [Erythrobacter sp.]|nr:hypothetical protein [Erythrobacter sp.]MBA4080304.1 hypothetical protein [Erythrobacter sp.]
MSGGEALSALKAALDRIDHSESNAEIRSIKADIAHAESKDKAVRDEIGKLADRIGAFSRPDGETIARAVLAGADLEDAALTGDSLRDLEERRAALVASLRPIAAHTDELRQALFVAEAKARAPMIAAAKPYVEHLRDRQLKAAAELVECDAAIVAIESGLRCQLDGAEKSRRAREGVATDWGLLGWVDVLRPPADLIEVLRPLSDASEAVNGFPTAIGTR